jgi:hypothetical protein
MSSGILVTCGLKVNPVGPAEFASGKCEADLVHPRIHFASDMRQCRK